MPRPEKVRAVEEIKERLDSARATFLTEYRGLSVTEQQTLRRGLRAAGGEFKVVKMTLARRAADELGLAITDDLSGPTALAFADDDAVGVARALRDFAKDHPALVLKSGVMGVTVLAPEQVSRLADIETREVLLAKIAGAAKAPLAGLAGAMSAFARNAASMFSQLLDKKDAAGPAAETDPTPADNGPAPEAGEAASAEAPTTGEPEEHAPSSNGEEE